VPVHAASAAPSSTRLAVTIHSPTNPSRTSAPETPAPTTPTPTSTTLPPKKTHSTTTAAPTASAATTPAPTTPALTKPAPTTQAPTRPSPTTAAPTAAAPTTAVPTTHALATQAPTTSAPRKPVPKSLASAKAASIPATTTGSKSKHADLIATDSVVFQRKAANIESKEDAERAELKNELRAELKSELTKEIISEQHKKVVSIPPVVHVVSAEKQNVHAKSTRIEHGRSEVKSSHATPKPSAVVIAKPHATTDEHPPTVRQASKIAPKQKTQELPAHQASLVAAESWFSEGPARQQHAILPVAKKHMVIPDTSQVAELKAELRTETNFRQEAAAEAASETGSSTSAWAPKAVTAAKDQVAELKAELSEERKLREAAAETAEVAKASLASSVAASVKAPATTRAPPVGAPTPAMRLVLPWQRQASANPVMGVVDDAKHGTMRGFAPVGLLAWIRNGFVQLTGGRLSWFFAANVPAVSVAQQESTTRKFTQKKAMRLLPTRTQDYAAVAAAARRDQQHNLELGNTWQEKEDEDADVVEELQHEDVYARSTAAKADQPHILTEKERAERSKEQVHISDVWSNLEEQDADIEASIDAMGADANLNSYGALDSIQDKSMAALTREVNLADEAPKTPRAVLSHHDESPEAKFLHEPFEEMQVSDEDAEHKIHHDPNLRQE